jgi:photosystem II stability/assembly factor-like uncharacterized protein
MTDSNTLLLVGTGKGAFVLQRSGGGEWKMDGPHFPGRSVYSMMLDTRASRNRVWAAAQSMHWGAELVRSDDMGKTWDSPEVMRVKFPDETGAALENIWQIAPGVDDETLFCGVAPAALFKSTDGGENWSLVRGLWDHPHREKWMPGFGGLCLHTIITDDENPNRMRIAVSSAGTYETDDGGENWTSTNTGISAYFMPDKYPEFGQCVHKIARHSRKKETLFLQNHHGVYRSRDDGRTWQEIENGLPSNFGFGVVTTRPGDAFIVPLQADAVRFTCEGKLRVYRTKDEGETWHPLTDGLPQENAYEVVLRDALASDDSEKGGVYFGTRNGKLYGSQDNGESWEQIQNALPEILCVKAYTL